VNGGREGESVVWYMSGGSELVSFDILATTDEVEEARKR
jgi:hypothetical protein